MADNGCRLWQDCFTCPYPDCLVGRIPSLLAASRMVDAMELAKQGLNNTEIAKRLGVTERTIYRYLDKIS